MNLLSKTTIVSLFAMLILSTPVRADQPSTHGMVLFGDRISYTSHLPMFHNPHDYQVLLQVDLSDLPRSQALNNYKLAKSSGTKLFTIAPETMDLTLVISGQKRSFQADLFNGHFERGGARLGRIVLNVVKVIYAAKLDEHAKRGELPTGIPTFENYLIFGEGGNSPANASVSEFYAVHLIGGKPNFDWIASLEVAESMRTSGPKLLSLPFVAAPQADGSPTVPTSGSVLGYQSGGAAALQAKVHEVIYVEHSDLEH